jgi:hypothetical protein
MEIYSYAYLLTSQDPFDVTFTATGKLKNIQCSLKRVKLSMFTHALKSYRGSKVIFHSFVTSTLNGGEWSTSRHRPPWKRNRYQLNRSLRGPQTRYERFGFWYIITTFLKKYTVFICIGHAYLCVIKHVESSGNSWERDWKEMLFIWRPKYRLHQPCCFVVSRSWSLQVNCEILHCNERHGVTVTILNRILFVIYLVQTSVGWSQFFFCFSAVCWNKCLESSTWNISQTFPSSLRLLTTIVSS